VTLLPGAVVSVDDATWKINTLLGLLRPSSVTLPVMASETGGL